MPTKEAIVDTLIPKEVEKPIPVRTISTREKKTQPKQQVIPPNPNQPNTSGNAPAAESAQTAESVKLSPTLSALARKEQAHRQRERALVEREKSLEAKLARAEQYDQLEAKLKAKDFTALEALGLNYEEYTKSLLERQAGEDPNSQKFKALEDEIQSLKKGQEEKAEQEFEETKAAYQREIKVLIDKDPDKFSSVRFADEKSNGEVQRGILQYILDTFEEEGEVPTVDEACQLFEDHLIEQGKVYSALPKLKPAPSAAPVDESTTLPPPRRTPNTLTNDMSPPAGTTAPKKSLQHLSDEERYAEARRRVLARRQQQQQGT
jgi:hypothetical protein